MKTFKSLPIKLKEEKNLSDEELLKLLSTNEYDSELHTLADEVRREIYGEDVYIRGLIEISNYCKNDCYYCGIRRGNKSAVRYRLTKDDILACCEEGYKLGFRTFVMQGGEDPYYTDDVMCGIVSAVRERYSDCAITLSLGERSYEATSRFIMRAQTDTF